MPKDQTFHESAYKFVFDQDWKVIKFDEHRFYLTLSGLSFSGMDFVGIHKETLYLIEVKNYNQYSGKKIVKEIDEFVNALKEKIKDTLQLFSIIHKYHQRRFLYRSLYPLVNKFPSLNKEWHFWTRLNTLSTNRSKVHFLLFIDSDFDNDLLKSKLLGQLENPKPKIKIIDLDGDEVEDIGIIRTKILS